MCIAGADAFAGKPAPARGLMVGFAWRTLANFSHGMPNMHRMVLCLALALSLGGCIDYKWGHDWKADSPGGWQDASVVGFDKGTAFQLACGGSPLYVNVETHASHQLLSLFFIPLFSASDDDGHVWIRASHPSLMACASPAQNPLLLKLDNRPIQAVGFSRRSGEGLCIIDLGPRELQGEQLSIEVNQALLPCAVAPMTLKKDSFFCLRATKFGGSTPCGR
ncbi:hypothetical protein ACIPI6_17110 [Pseudomonas protegens]|uniref:hypothetical protein n=2 Tax=Pseudomonas TaxID=286 RepID=UPI0037F80E77